tara:strand:- start:104 stop:238 length:135 start_codon:yes stop_codon:yes gene_type:complete
LGYNKKKLGGPMEKAKQLWTLAKTNPKISAAVVVVIVAIYFLAA